MTYLQHQNACDWPIYIRERTIIGSEPILGVLYRLLLYRPILRASL